MSFSPEIFRKKLDALQETQDSIVSISQWVLFHHRHATHLCELWAGYTLDNNASAQSKKKLSLLYLCNDVVQQARHKRKPEFTAGFAAKLPRVFHAIYGSVDSAIKPKIERLISVWSQRNVFSKSQIDAMSRALRLSEKGEEFTEDTAESESAAKSAPNNASDTQIAPELVHLNTLYTQMNTLVATGSANFAQAQSQAQTFLPSDLSASDHLPSPKVYVSKLNVLEKLCQMTIKTLEETEKTRADILAALTQLSGQVSGSPTGKDEKMVTLNEYLVKLASTRSELLELIDEPEATHEAPESNTNNTGIEEPSPVFESASNSNADNLVPTYEDSSDDSDAEPLAPPKRAMGESSNYDDPAKKRKVSNSSLFSSSSKKSVAFSEEIEVKEFERDEQSNFIDIMGDSGSHDGNEDDDEYELQDPADTFEAHHKDAVELMHEQQGAGINGNGASDNGEDKGALLDLLSKLT
ncbi:hypothetical protein OY671_006791 [Metschnikowia pulcherrima]|nr:hypothetical protein OY671_006791 [Metschnikowia pulcherrima]